MEVVRALLAAGAAEDQATHDGATPSERATVCNAWTGNKIFQHEENVRYTYDMYDRQQLAIMDNITTEFSIWKNPAGEDKQGLQDASAITPCRKPC